MSIDHYLLVLLIVGVAEGKYSQGVLTTTDETWAYLERFCFISELGNLNFKLRFPADVGLQSLLLYFDTEDQWDAVYRANKTCEEKVGQLEPDNNQQIRLTPNEDRFYDHTTRCIIEHPDKSGMEWIECQGNRRFVSQRARWWYMAISNCEIDETSDFVKNMSNGIYVEYTIEMTNGDPDQIWFYQFSADEFCELIDILPVNIVFLIIECAMFLLAITVAFILRTRHLFHQTFKVFLEAIFMECMSLFFMCCAYGRYAQDGIGLPLLKLMGQICRAICTITFVFLLLLIAKGYTITRGRMSSSSTGKLTVIITLFITSYLAMFVWALKIFDPAQVTYISESLPGYLLAVLRVLAWVSYSVSSIRTFTKYPQKKEFYVVMGCLLTIWFWMGPITLCIANFLLDNWVREEVVNLVDNLVVFYGFFVFMVLTWPSTANKNFPYHVRTTQIADCSSTNFPQNAYEVRYNNTHEGTATIENVGSQCSREDSDISSTPRGDDN